MAFSTQRAVSDGTLQLLQLSINFFDKSEITVYFDNVPTTAYTWATSNSIHFDSVVPNGVEALIRRTTDLSEVRHVFSLGAQFKDSTLDDDFRQILHIAQEAVEGANVGDIYSTLNMHGNTITNVGLATAPGDAVSLGQIAVESSSAWLANTQAQAAASAAGVSQSSAAASAAAASGSAASASGSATTATTQAGISTTQAGLSATARAGAEAAQTAAAASSTLAQKWAAEVEDVVVSGGLYSAYHYSRKSAASATAAGASATAAAASAASISMPAIAGKALQFLRANAGETGLEYVPFTTVFRANLLGTVSQSAGVPTGAVAETVTVSGGTAVKYADGTMILTLRHIVTRTLGTALNGMVLTAGQENGIAYGVTFVGVPNEHVTAMKVAGDAAIFWSTTSENTTTTSCGGYLAALGNQASTNYVIKRTVIGRWF